MNPIMQQQPNFVTLGQQQLQQNLQMGGGAGFMINPQGQIVSGMDGQYQQQQPQFYTQPQNLPQQYQIAYQ